MNMPRPVIWIAASLFAATALFPVGNMFWAPLGGGAAGLAGLWRGLWEARQLGLALNSLIIAGGTALACLLVGVPLALLCRRTDMWGRGALSRICLLPVLIPPHIHAIVWRRISPALLATFGFDLHGLSGVILVLSCAYFPFVTLTAMAGLASMERSLEEAAMMRHGAPTTLGRITLPLALPHILSGAVFVFVFSLVNVSVPDLLRVRTYPLEIFVQFSAFYDNGAAALLALPLVALTALLLAAQKIYMGERSYVQLHGGGERPLILGLGPWRLPALLFCLVAVGLSVLLPLAVLGYTAGAPDAYLGVLRSSAAELGYSLVLALSGGGLTLLVAFPLAYFTVRDGGLFSKGLAWASLLPLAIPGTTMGIGMIGVWNNPLVDRVYGSSSIIVLGYVARFIPFAVILLATAVRRMHPNQEEAASIAGAGGMKIIRRIVAPLCRRGALAAFFIVFLLSFGELGATLLVIPPGRETITIRIYNMMHYGAERQVAALSLIFIVIVIAATGLFMACGRRLPAVGEAVRGPGRSEP